MPSFSHRAESPGSVASSERASKWTLSSPFALREMRKSARPAVFRPARLLHALRDRRGAAHLGDQALADAFHAVRARFLSAPPSQHRPGARRTGLRDRAAARGVSDQEVSTSSAASGRTTSSICGSTIASGRSSAPFGRHSGARSLRRRRGRRRSRGRSMACRWIARSSCSAARSPRDEASRRCSKRPRWPARRGRTSPSC